MIWVGIIGVKGYFGDALSKLVAGHPETQLSTVMDLQELCDERMCVCAGSEKGSAYWSMVDAVKKSDIIFNGLYGSMAEEVYSKAVSYGKKIIDINNERRIGRCIEGSAVSAYPGSVYGLSELYKKKMRDVSIAENPSSYCAGALLGLAPLISGGLIKTDSVSIESKSGIAGLRRNDRLKETGMVGNNGVKIYKVDCTDYGEEVNEQISTLFGEKASVPYVSYIIPGTRGIATTIKADSGSRMSGSDVLDIYRDFYKSSPFIEVCGSNPVNAAKNGFNNSLCRIGASVDADSGKIEVVTVLDDAIREVAVQAIQTMNLMYGIDEKTGL